MTDASQSEVLRPSQPCTLADVQIAFHEAGHAAVAHALGWRLRTVSIVPRTATEAGYVDVKQPRVPIPSKRVVRIREMRQIKTEEIVILLAGQAAVRKIWADASPMYMARNDYMRVVALLDLLASNAPQRALMWATQEAEAEGRLEARWQAVTDLAEEILQRRTMTGREVSRFLQDADDRQVRKTREATETTRPQLTPEEIERHSNSQREMLLSLLPSYVAAAFDAPSKDIDR